MPEINAAELSHIHTVPEAVINKPARGATPEHTTSVTQLAEKYKGDNTESHFTVETQHVPKLAEIDVTIQQTIEGDRSTGHIVRSPEQIHRINQAEEAAKLAFEVIDKGYANLSSGQKRQIQERVLPAMMRFWPELNSVLQTMTRRERQVAMEDLLNDPKFHHELLAAVTSIQTEYNKPEEEKTSSYQTKKEAFDKKKLELDGVKHDYEDAQTKDTDYASGAKARELRDLDDIQMLNAKVERTKLNLSTANKELEQINNRIRTLEAYEHYTGSDAGALAKRAEAGGSLPGLRERLTALRDTIIPDRIEEFTNADRDAKKRTDLEKEKGEAHSKEKELRLREEALEHELEKARDEMLDAQADKEIAELKKVAREKGLVVDLQSVFAKAAEKVVEARATAAEQARETLLNSPEATQEALDRTTNAEKKYYLNSDGTLNKAKIKADYQRLVSGKLDDITRQVLMQQGLSVDEANEKLDGKKAETAAELIARYRQTGNKMKKGEVERIVNSNEGTDIIASAIARSDALAKAFDDAYKAAIPQDHVEKEHKEGHTKERLKKIKEIVSHIPTPHKETILNVALLAGVGFFAGPAIINAALPHIHHAAARWVVESKRHHFVAKAGKIAKEAPHKVAHAASVVEDKVL